VITLFTTTVKRDGDVIIDKFPDGESYVRVRKKTWLGQCVRLVHSFYPLQDKRLVEALIAATVFDGAERLELVMPYFPYARQDRITREGEGWSLKAVFKALKSAGYERVITFDAHFLKREGVFKVWGVEVVNVSLLKLLVERVGGGYYVLGADSGMYYITNNVVEKRRAEQPNGVVRPIHSITLPIINAQRVLVVDDIVASGGTLLKVVEALKARGVREVSVAVTHALLLNDAYERLKQHITHFFSTNTVPSSPDHTVKFEEVLQRIEC